MPTANGAIAVSPNGRYLVAQGNAPTYSDPTGAQSVIYDLVEQRVIGQVAGGTLLHARFMAFSPDSSMVYVNFERRPQTAYGFQKIDLMSATLHYEVITRDRVRDLAVTPGGRVYAAVGACGRPRDVMVFRTSDGRPAAPSINVYVRDLATIADGNLYVNLGGTIERRDLETGAYLGVLVTGACVVSIDGGPGGTLAGTAEDVHGFLDAIVISPATGGAALVGLPDDADGGVTIGGTPLN